MKTLERVLLGVFAVSGHPRRIPGAGRGWTVAVGENARGLSFDVESMTGSHFFDALAPAFLSCGNSGFSGGSGPIESDRTLGKCWTSAEAVDQEGVEVAEGVVVMDGIAGVLLPLPDQ